MSDDQARKLALLGALAQLEEQARNGGSVEELGFLLVNESRHLVDYHQLVLFTPTASGGLAVRLVSGLPEFDANAPYLVWLTAFLVRARQDKGEGKPIAFAEGELSGKDRDAFREWLPSHGYWQPLVAPSGASLGGVFLSRAVPLAAPEQWLMGRIAATFAHAWEGLELRRLAAGGIGPRRMFREKGLGLLLASAVVAAMFVPVRLSVLAPAVIAPIAPLVVSSPLDGVVKAFHVDPNQEVKAGAPLFSLDDTEERSRHEVARRALAVAREELARSTRKGFRDDRSKGEVALLTARMRIKEAELSHAALRLSRITVHAEQDGVAVFDDPNDWIGKPVRTGERILSLADHAQTQVEAWLPVEDAMVLTPGSRVLIFLNVRPTHPLEASLRQADFEARNSPQGVLAFRVKAGFVSGTEPPRIGLRGTAKIHGEKVTLFYYLFRRPFAALRQMVGW